MTEHEWTHNGIECAVLMHPSLGHRCGYARVPLGHPWHGVSYSDELPGARVDESRPVETNYLEAFIYALGDKKATLSLLVSVHGGLTFSGPHYWRDKREGWWLGFDCGHCDDAPDPAVVTSRYRTEGHVWALTEVIAETEHLADQIVAQRGAFQLEDRHA